MEKIDPSESIKSRLSDDLLEADKILILNDLDDEGISKKFPPSKKNLLIRKDNDCDEPKESEEIKDDEVSEVSKDSKETEEIKEETFISRINLYMQKIIYKDKYTMLFKNKPKGLVLSGGSIRGIVHLGVLHYFNTLGLLTDITHYAGTSVGGFIVYLLSIEYTPLEIFVFLNTHDLSKNFESMNFIGLLLTMGLYSYQPINDHLKELTLKKFKFIPTLKELYERTKKTLIFTTVNRTQKKLVYVSYINFPDLPITTALQMTSSLPVVFDRFFYKEENYIDGGIGDDYPVCYMDKLLPPEVNIIGCLLHSELSEKDDNILEYIYSAMALSQQIQEHTSKEQVSSRVFNFVLKTVKGNVFNMKSTPGEKLALFVKGYTNIKKELEETDF